MIRYLMNIILVLDQVVNVLFLGDPDETISARAGKKHPKLAKIIDKIFWFDKRHCERAFRADPDEGLNYLSAEDRQQVMLFYVVLVILFLVF